MCMQEVDRDLLPPPMVIKITDRIKWSPELQRRFLRAIELLGGPEKATASSIFYLMNVKGLTVDHVKSHLQSYRQALEQESTKKSKLASTASVTLDSKGPRKAIRSASVALAPEGPSKPRTANKLIKGKEKAYDGTLEKKMLYEEEIQKHEEAQNRGLEFFMQFPGQQTIGNFEQVTGLGVIPTLSNDFPNVYTPYASYSAAGNYYLNPPVQGGSPDSNGFYPFPVGWL